MPITKKERVPSVYCVRLYTTLILVAVVLISGWLVLIKKSEELKLITKVSAIFCSIVLLAIF